MNDTIPLSLNTTPTNSVEGGLGLCVGAWALSAVTLGGNFLTIAAVAQVQRLRTLSNLYIASLACADGVVGLIMPVLGLSFLPDFSNWFHNSYPACMALLTLIFMSAFCSGIHLFLVTVDRYIYIVHPFLYTRVVTEKTVAANVAFAWIASLLYGCGPFLANKFQQVGRCDSWRVLQPEYNVYASGGMFFVTCLMIAGLYAKILHLALSKQKHTMADFLKPSDALGIRSEPGSSRPDGEHRGATKPEHYNDARDVNGRAMAGCSDGKDKQNEEQTSNERDIITTDKNISNKEYKERDSRDENKSGYKVDSNETRAASEHDNEPNSATVRDKNGEIRFHTDTENIKHAAAYNSNGNSNKGTADNKTINHSELVRTTHTHIIGSEESFNISALPNETLRKQEDTAACAVDKTSENTSKDAAKTGRENGQNESRPDEGDDNSVSLMSCFYGTADCKEAFDSCYRTREYESECDEPDLSCSPARGFEPKQSPNPDFEAMHLSFVGACTNVHAPTETDSGPKTFTPLGFHSSSASDIAVLCTVNDNNNAIYTSKIIGRETEHTGSVPRTISLPTLHSPSARRNGCDISIISSHQKTSVFKSPAIGTETGNGNTSEKSSLNVNHIVTSAMGNGRKTSASSTGGVSETECSDSSRKSSCEKECIKSSRKTSLKINHVVPVTSETTAGTMTTSFCAGVDPGIFFTSHSTLNPLSPISPSAQLSGERYGAQRVNGSPKTATTRLANEDDARTSLQQSATAHLPSKEHGNSDADYQHGNKAAQSRTKSKKQWLIHWRSARLFICVFGCYFGFWLPYFSALSVNFFQPVSGDLLNLFALFGLCNSAVNFFVYAFMNKDFRSYFRRRLLCTFGHVNSIDTYARNTT